MFEASTVCGMSNNYFNPYSIWLTSISTFESSNVFYI